MKTVPLLLAVLATTVAIPPDISDVKRNCIDGCKCTFGSLYTLKISRCSKNISLNNHIFANLGMEKLNTIEFVGAVIDKIENDAFDVLKRLDTLSFKNSHIDNIEEDAFDLPEIEKINFNGCSFNGTIPIFNSDQVTEIILKKCNLLKMPEFGDLPFLETLDLSDNYIKKIKRGAFEELESLETLNLSNNNVTMLPSDVFYDNLSLNTLIVDKNPLKFFTVNSELSLEYLSLKSCQLTTFDDRTTKYLNTVTKLYLNDNKIAFFPNEAVENMTDLRVLDLSGNNLKHLDANVFRNNKELKHLILDNNSFDTLPPFAVANGTFPVAYMSCKDCQLRFLSKDTFKHMPSIEKLDLSRNNLNNIDNVLKDIPSLVELDLSHNGIFMFTTSTFKENYNLKTLRLKGNSLFRINPKWFTNNKVLSHLDIGGTYLTEIWSSNKTKIPSLQTLIISNNKIKHISPTDLQVTPKLKYIYLENNPFICSQDFKDALKWLSANKVLRVAEMKREQQDFIGGNVKMWRQLGKEVCPKEDIFETPEKVKEIKQEYLEDGDDDDDENDDVEIEDPIDKDKDYTDSDTDYYYYYDDEDTTTHSTNAINYKITNTSKITSIEQEIDELKEYENIGFDQMQAVELENRYTLTKTSYVILVTSIFMLTALLVVFVTVSVTMLFLKRNRNLHMERANLPRFKIPLWSAIPAQKKHSGSVYQTLTEDCSGPKTPQINRYEFKSSPAVPTHTHSASA